eukprot:6480573-Amphidinium_carterae.1
MLLSWLSGLQAEQVVIRMNCKGVARSRLHVHLTHTSNLKYCVHRFLFSEEKSSESELPYVTTSVSIRHNLLVHACLDLCLWHESGYLPNLRSAPTKVTLSGTGRNQKWSQLQSGQMQFGMNPSLLIGSHSFIRSSLQQPLYSFHANVENPHDILPDEIAQQVTYVFTESRKETTTDKAKTLMQWARLVASCSHFCCNRADDNVVLTGQWQLAELGCLPIIKLSTQTVREFSDCALRDELRDERHLQQVSM